MPLVSIIIPVFNQVKYTRTVIESIRTHTPEPYELIIVDNASTDGTASYLASLSGVKVVRNQRNLGHAGGTNRGIRASLGEYQVWLNNDAVVTKNWLTNMLICASSDDRIGLVAPLTNYIGQPQQLQKVHFDDMAEMHAFAADFNRSDPSRWLTADPFGFCCLVPRRVVAEVGELAEDNDLGLGDDIDYTRRLRQKGYHSVIAQDTFVYHFGSRTFFTIWETRRRLGVSAPPPMVPPPGIA